MWLCHRWCLHNHSLLAIWTQIIPDGAGGTADSCGHVWISIATSFAFLLPMELHLSTCLCAGKNHCQRKFQSNLSSP
jgi:hypothetical protein